MDQVKWITNGYFQKELIKKSGGVVWQTFIMIRQAQATDDQVIAKLRKDFLSISMMNQAREELRKLVQASNQPVSVYIYKYTPLNFLSGWRPYEETHLFAI